MFVIVRMVSNPSQNYQIRRAYPMQDFLTVALDVLVFQLSMAYHAMQYHLG